MPNEFVAKNGIIAQNNSVVSGSLIVTNGITGSLFGTSSQALSASYTATSSFGLNAISASYAFTASSATNAFQAVSSSFATTASSAISSSLSQTASFSLRGIGSFTGSFSGSFSGSLFGTASQAITASYAINAANAFIQGGNSFGTTATIGTNDAQALSLETNAISRIQVLNDGNISVQPTASMRPFMDGMYIDTHPESNNPAIIPYLGNDIAYNTLRGGTFTGTPGPGSTYVTSTSLIEAMFDGSPTYAVFPAEQLSGSYTASIVFPQSYQYTNTIGFSFGSTSWRARDFKVEILVTGSYYTLDTVTNWQYANYNKVFSYGAENVQGARITFSNFNNGSPGSGFRIADIYILNYNSIYGKGIYVGRDGGQIYKGITVTGSVVVTSGGFTGSLFGTASQAVTSSFALRGNGSFTGSFSGSVTASLFGTASQATSASYAFTASSASTAFSASFAQTSSFANNFTVANTLTAQTLVVSTVSSSVVYSSGSNIFGNSTANTQTMTGSLNVSGSATIIGRVTATNLTGSLFGTASWATNFVTGSVTSASYAFTASSAISSSFASTASFVNTLNQNVVITGSLTIGTGSGNSIGENTLTIGPAGAGGSGEGGQLLLMAKSDGYTSASMLDNYQNLTRLLRGTNTGSDAVVWSANMHTKQIQFPAYNSSAAFPGTVAANLAVDSSGNILTVAAGTVISASYAFTASSAVSSSYAYTASSATTASTVVATVTGTNSTELVRGNMADNDQFRILIGGTGTNAGYAEIATADDGTEPIYVRQYTGVFSSLTRTATLLDGSGNTSFPGTVSATFSGNLTGTASFASNYLGSGSISTRLTNLETASANLTTASGSFSTRVTQIERTYATTGSNIYTGSQNILGAITASAALINGTITAQTLVVTTVSSSVVFSSGSNIFGNSTANTQTMTGSLNVSGSATIVGRVTATDLTGSLFGTASQALTASYVLAAGVVGLNLSLISTGSVSASVGQSTSSFQVVSGSINLFYVSSSGNIGVGTVAPRARVHASGSNTGIIGDANDNFFGNYTAGDYIDVGNLGTTGTVFLDTRGTSTNVNLSYRTKGTGNHIWTYAGGTVETMRIVGGNFGIGVTNPSAILHISGSDTGSLFRISSHTSSSLFFVSGSGNIGIGTITPEFKLDVSGSGQARIGAAELGNWPSVTNYAFFGHERLDQTAAGNYALLQDSGGSTYVNASTGRFIALRINNVTTATIESTRFTFTGSFGLSGSMLVTGSITGSLSGSVTGSLFGTASQAISSSYALTASYALNAGGGGGVSFPYTGSAQITGSLGVTGSFSVSANQGSSVFSSNADTLLITGSLVITGSGAAITGSLNVSNGITGSLFGTASQAITASYALTASYVASIAGLSTSQIATGSITASVSLGSGSFAVTSGSSTFLFVSSSGNVGFGTTTNLNDRLTVLGNATIGRSNTTSQVYIGLGTPGTVTPSSLFWSFGLLANSNDFNIQSYDGTTLSSRLRIDTSGRVGIGTSTPSASLDVSGSVRITNGLSETGSVNISGSLTVTGSITTNGTITAQTLVVQTITSSITYSSGSNIFGNALTNTQTMTGSVNITGSLNLYGDSYYRISASAAPFMKIGVAGGLYPSLTAFNSSGVAKSQWINANGNMYFDYDGVGGTSLHFRRQQDSDSNTVARFMPSGNLLLQNAGTYTDNGYKLQIQPSGSASGSLYVSGSSSFSGSLNVSQGITASLFGTASWATNFITGSVTSASYAFTASSAISSSLAQTASFALRGSGAFTGSFSGSFTGSLFGTASQALTASYAMGGSASSILFQTASAATTWSFNHFLQTQYPVFTIYDEGNNVIVPQQITAVDTSSALIYFSSPKRGVAVASKGGYSASVVTSATTANTAITASYALFALSASNAPGFTFTFSQSLSAVTWSINHNMNTRTPLVQVYDINYNQLIPNQVVSVTQNLTEVRFDYGQNGYAVLSSGMAPFVTGSTSLLNQTTPALTWSFAHNLNTKYVNFEVYDSTDYTMIPSAIRVIDTNNAEIHMAYPTTGRAVANFSGINGQMNAQTASLALTASFVRPLSQSVAITGSGTTNSTLDITGIRTNSAVNPPVGTISLYYPGADGATANVHGASIMFSQRYDAASAVPIGIGMIAGVKVNSGGNFGGGLTFWTSNQTNNNLVERMRIDASGSVGIGLTSPRALLHISGSSLSASLFQVSSTSNNNALVVSGSGNVGVSKANPAATLDVSGSMLVTGSFGMSGSFTQNGYSILTAVSQSLNFANDAAAATGGVPLGGLYRSGNFILIRLS